jgi:hypothetical protein
MFRCNCTPLTLALGRQVAGGDGAQAPVALHLVGVLPARLPGLQAGCVHLLARCASRHQQHSDENACGTLHHPAKNPGSREGVSSSRWRSPVSDVWTLAVKSSWSSEQSTAQAKSLQRSAAKAAEARRSRR